MSVTSAKIWLKGIEKDRYYPLTAAHNYTEGASLIIRGFGIRGAYLNVCIEADPTDTSGQADFDKLGELSLLQMKRQITTWPNGMIRASWYELDDDALEIEVVADWQLACYVKPGSLTSALCKPLEDDGKACYVKHVRGFLG